MKRIIATAFGAALLPAAAMAASAGSVSTDLNMRHGPGTNYDVVATIPAGSRVTIGDCLPGRNWCEVAWGGYSGYASASYLRSRGAGRPVVRDYVGAVDRRPVPADPLGQTAGGLVGALGAVLGGVAQAITPEPQTYSYIRRNPIDPYYVDRDVYVGSRLPRGAVLRDVPRSRYHYANVNGDRVLVDPYTREVVYVYR